MRVLALLSGGKDSVAAAEVVQGHGWDVVGALCVHPREDDAYMFHTPNLDVVDAVAQCLGMPLRHVSTPPDPVEEVGEFAQALALANAEMKLDGIISGALASEYQRTRIDRVCHGLGLRSFAPVWHKDPSIYLASLLHAGYDIRFSRVAAEGLDLSWAGARLTAERLAHLRSLRLHAAGEGGEYETIVLDAPHYRARIVVDDAEVETTASRATWVARSWHLEAKPGPGRAGP